MEAAERGGKAAGFDEGYTYGYEDGVRAEKGRQKLVNRIIRAGLKVKSVFSRKAQAGDTEEK